MVQMLGDAGVFGDEIKESLEVRERSVAMIPIKVTCLDVEMRKVLVNCVDVSTD